MENTQNPSKTDESVIENVFELMRDKQSSSGGEKEIKSNGSFKTLPNGEYVGQVYIKTNTVAKEDSPNYGLKKYQFEYTVTEGEHKGMMAYFHCVILPHELATTPTKTDMLKYEKWQAAALLSVEKSNKYLQKCGVDISELNFALISRRIAENNRRKPIVNFTMKDGTPHTNYIISANVEDKDDSLFHDSAPPNGNDAPLV
ncbi:MAG TPA: hypothetical protein VK308_07890 [Pyrinomonadaceae bacterium]|nr:hypothetical protein [Pyrinomonadaceae bacterium]